MYKQVVEGAEALRVAMQPPAVVTAGVDVDVRLDVPSVSVRAGEASRAGPCIRSRG